MWRFSMKLAQVLAALSLTMAIAGMGATGTGRAQPMTNAPVPLLGLTSGNQLVSFMSNNPTQVKMMRVTGVDGKLLAIDQRPANGLLYGLSDKSQLYTINPSSGVATLVSRLAKPLAEDAKVSIDFNPVPDRLRVVDGNGNNFRINVDTGEVTTDKALAYIPEDPNTGKPPRIAAVAYTNAFAGPPSPAGVTPPTRTSQMFNLDTKLNVLVQQNPPNDGRLKTIGNVDMNLDSRVGLDIFSPKMGENTAFVVSNSMLYSINLATGKTNSLGTVGQGRLNLIDLASVTMP
jgi:hypothetical protein